MEFFSIYDITYSYSVTWGVTETKAQNDNFRVKYVTPQQWTPCQKNRNVIWGTHNIRCSVKFARTCWVNFFLLNKRVQTNEKYTQIFKLVSKVIKLETQQTSRSLE